MTAYVIMTVVNGLFVLAGFYAARRSSKSADLSHDFSQNAASYTNDARYHADRAADAAKRATIERAVAEECVLGVTDPAPAPQPPGQVLRLAQLSDEPPCPRSH